LLRAAVERGEADVTAQAGEAVRHLTRPT
jgi:hypothetical protein